MQRAPEPLAAWQRDETLQKLEARLLVSAGRPRVVSFDFFDTLIFRLCAEPSDLFVEIGRQLEKNGLLRSEVSPAAFRTIRLTAEAKAREGVARTGRYPELKLADIYAELREVVSDLDAARELEFRVERSVSFHNPAMVSLAQHVRDLGCKTAIVSDTYFSREQLLRLLEDHGVPSSLFDALFVSCERGKAKQNGTLYQDLLKQFDVHPGEVLHIGDNLHADVHMARRLGIDTHQYCRTTPPLKSVFVGERKQVSPGVRPVGSLETLRVSTARRARGDADAYRDGALVLGPVLSRFADWSVGKYARAGVTRVLALMREGELLGELLDRSARAAGVKLEVVQCYASRVATARAAMPEVDVESAAELLEGAHQITPQAMLDILGLGDEASQFLDDQMRTRPLPSHQAAVDLLRVLFRMPVIKERIEACHRESQALAFEYLASLVGDASKIGILDLGWSGSVQRNIARILRRDQRDLRTIGCYLACTPRAARLALEGHEAHAYLGHDWDRVAILPEVSIAACVGSTSGYQRDASGRVVPVLEATAPEQIAIKQRLRHGVLDFQERWLPIAYRTGDLAVPVDVLLDIDRLSPAILYRWMDFPTKPEADRLGGLVYDKNDFGQAKSATLCDEETRAQFRREGARAVFENPRCYWPQGIMAQVYPRMVSVVRDRWSDPRDLGRIGASGAPGAEETGLVDSEHAALPYWLDKFASRQVVFCGPLAPSIIELVGESGKAGPPPAGGAPRLIVAAGCPFCPKGEPESCGRVHRDPAGDDPSSTCVRGHYSDPGTLRAIRALLGPDSDVALVLTGDVSEADVTSLLNGLSPFLGPKGVILAGVGRYDRDEIAARSAVGRPLHAWLVSSGPKVGFAAFLGAPADRTASRDWLVFWHSPEAMDWSRQWMPVVADLDHLAPSTRESAGSGDDASSESAPVIAAAPLETGSSGVAASAATADS